VPILSSSSYLTARFTAPSSAPLLAGKVALFRDGAFVGQGQIPFVNGGTKFDLGFGVDDSVKVTRVAIDRAVAETGILTSKRTDTRRFRIKVENLHKQPIRITVLDRMPYRRRERHRRQARRHDRPDSRGCRRPARRACLELHLRAG
jgi:uncharacterized protein (TIGR02231 family)